MADIKQQIIKVKSRFIHNNSLLKQFNDNLIELESKLRFPRCNPTNFKFFLPYEYTNFAKGTTRHLNRYINVYIQYISEIMKFFSDIYLYVKNELNDIKELIEALEKLLENFKKIKFTRSDEVFFKPQRLADNLALHIDEIKQIYEQISIKFADLNQSLIRNLIEEFDRFKSEQQEKTYYSRIYMRIDGSNDTLDVDNFIKISREIFQRHIQLLAREDESIDKSLLESPFLLINEDDYGSLALDLANVMRSERTNKENLCPANK